MLRGDAMQGNSFVQSVREQAPLIAASVDETDRSRNLLAALFEQLVAHSLFQLFQPQDFCGHTSWTLF